MSFAYRVCELRVAAGRHLQAIGGSIAPRGVARPEADCRRARSPPSWSRASTGTTGCSAPRAPRRRSGSSALPGPRRSGRCRSGSSSTTSACANASTGCGPSSTSTRSTTSVWQEAKLALHRPARRPLAARARRDVLQLGDHEDPAAELLRQRPDLRPRRRSRPSTSSPIRRSTAATTRSRRRPRRRFAAGLRRLRLETPVRRPRARRRPAGRARSSAGRRRGRTSSRITRSRC